MQISVEISELKRMNNEIAEMAAAAAVAEQNSEIAIP